MGLPELARLSSDWWTTPGCGCQPFPLRRFVDPGQQDGAAEPAGPDGCLRPCRL